ncbi:hypothetical protein [Bacillus pseudomycoides]|uniref:hypothetical protein n=1 Tax=Bacillus pseudomycoides TaxID=64104 RepID=UPI003703EF68
MRYLYPHHYPNASLHHQYLPHKIKNNQYYTPKTTPKFQQPLSPLYQTFQTSHKTKPKR